MRGFEKDLNNEERALMKRFLIVVDEGDNVEEDETNGQETVNFTQTILEREQKSGKLNQECA